MASIKEDINKKFSCNFSREFRNFDQKSIFEKRSNWAEK